MIHEAPVRRAIHQWSTTVFLGHRLVKYHTIFSWNILYEAEVAVHFFLFVLFYLLVSGKSFFTIKLSYFKYIVKRCFWKYL